MATKATGTAKPSKAASSKAKAANAPSGGSGIAELVKRSAVATFEHGGIAEEVFAWGTRWLVAVALDGASRFSEGSWALVLVDADGREASRTVLDKVVVSKFLLLGDELVVIEGEKTSLRVLVFRQSADGAIERAGERPGDASTQRLWAAHAYAVAVGPELVLVKDRDAHALVVYRIGGGGTLTELSSTKIEIGTKAQFIDNQGFSGVALLGAYAILSGPQQKTGYQVVDLSDPARPRPIANVKTVGPVLQESVAFVAEDRMLAFGAGGQAMFLDLARDEGRLTAHKVIKTGQHFSRVYLDGGECLLYDGNKRDTGVCVAPGRELGKLKLPVDAVAITALGDHVMLTGTQRSLIVRGRD